MKAATRQANFTLPEDLLDEAQACRAKGPTEPSGGRSLEKRAGADQVQAGAGAELRRVGRVQASRAGERNGALRPLAPEVVSTTSAPREMSKILLDTDVLIDLLRGRSDTHAFLVEATRHAVPCCSVISVAELHAGMRPAESASTTALLDALVIVPVSRQIAEVAGQFKARARIRRSRARRLPDRRDSLHRRGLPGNGQRARLPDAGSHRAKGAKVTGTVRS